MDAKILSKKNGRKNPEYIKKKVRSTVKKKSSTIDAKQAQLWQSCTIGVAVSVVHGTKIATNGYKFGDTGLGYYTNEHKEHNPTQLLSGYSISKQSFRTRRDVRLFIEQTAALIDWQHEDIRKILTRELWEVMKGIEDTIKSTKHTR